MGTLIFLILGGLRATVAHVGAVIAGALACAGATKSLLCLLPEALRRTSLAARISDEPGRVVTRRQVVSTGLHEGEDLARSKTLAGHRSVKVS